MPQINRTEYKTGQKVCVILDGSKFITDKMKYFNHQTYHISRVRHLKQRGTTHYWTYYELEGCVSEKGVPYSFVGEWLIDMGD